MDAKQNHSENRPENEVVTLGGGYPLFQIAKALTTAQSHPDAATRARAKEKMAKWRAVFTAMHDGSLMIGDRTPISEVPAWVTLEVITGGFATGELLAGGPLRDYERQWLQSIAPENGPEDNTPDNYSISHSINHQRHCLNRYFISDAGLTRLQAMLQTGNYSIEVPEEGALLVVAWLLHHNQAEAARSLLSTLSPWFNQLRFYPAERSQPQSTSQLSDQSVSQSTSTQVSPPVSAHVYVQTVDDVRQQLKQINTNQRFLAQKEAIEIWTPLYDRLISLFLETVEGDVPSLQTDEQGQWVRSPDGRFPVIGGWPMQHFPPDWTSRAQSLLNDFAKQQQQHRHCGRPTRKKGSLAQLHTALKRCIHHTDQAGDRSAGNCSLSGREVGRIRLLLARYITKRGLPSGERCQQIRQQQQQQIATPNFKDIAQVVIARLANHPATAGLLYPEQALSPVEPQEAKTWQLPPDTLIPKTIQRKVNKALQAPVEELIEKGLITSAESLARILPHITSEIAALGIQDLGLRQLYASIYQAFRQRRSLLLLNLQTQVKIEELPWIGAISPYKGQSLSASAIATDSLSDITTLTLSAFPHSILPNKLLQEINALAKTAELNIPITKEIAADIFMGGFSQKFVESTFIAAELLTGSLYERYYAIDYPQVQANLSAYQSAGNRPQSESHQRSNSKLFNKIAGWVHLSKEDRRIAAFNQVCKDRASRNWRGSSNDGYSVAANGMIIEQQQILTTHNLAVLYRSAQIEKRLSNTLPTLAQRCFIWICQRLQVKPDNWHTSLIQIKQAAYAWRQMLFFLSFISSSEVQAFVTWANEHLQDQSGEFQQRFGPAMIGLLSVVNGQDIESESAQQKGARRFLGWSIQPHWLANRID